jgi:hypothetical protein
MTTDNNTDRDQDPDRVIGATRRNVLAGAGAAMVGWEAAPALAEAVIPEARAAIPAPQKDEIAVTLLGSGTPFPDYGDLAPGLDLICRLQTATRVE